MVSVEFSARALAQLEEIDPIITKRIVEKIVWLQQNFDSVVPERLHHSLRDKYKLRVGDYRVVYSITANVLLIEKVKHRREVYK